MENITEKIKTFGEDENAQKISVSDKNNWIES